ncbi:hypothetical protein [Thermococcus sp.]|uniref:hypothetical protein n=1 Tax=Thermococcus sp. TaxID=35749 RepID=UPI002608236F|nr:hypothetical protein [Thermococcus sp.]
MKEHKERVKKAVEAFKELYSENSIRIRVAEALAGGLANNQFFTFVNHDYDVIEDEFEAAFDFAKFLAYTFDDWALVTFSSEVEGHEGKWVMSKELGIVRVEEDEKFAKEMEYLFTKAEFLKAKRKLAKLEKERGGGE